MEGSTHGLSVRVSGLSGAAKSGRCSLSPPGRHCELRRRRPDHRRRSQPVSCLSRSERPHFCPKTQGGAPGRRAGQPITSRRALKGGDKRTRGLRCTRKRQRGPCYSAREGWRLAAGEGAVVLVAIKRQVFAGQGGKRGRRAAGVVRFARCDRGIAGGREGRGRRGSRACIARVQVSLRCCESASRPSEDGGVTASSRGLVASRAAWRGWKHSREGYSSSSGHLYDA